MNSGVGTITCSNISTMKFKILMKISEKNRGILITDDEGYVEVLGHGCITAQDYSDYSDMLSKYGHENKLIVEVTEDELGLS